MPRPPDKTESHVVSGILFRFSYYFRRRDVVVAPDHSDLASACAYDVLRAWLKVADWSRRFAEANPGWKVNGAAYAETLGD